MPKRVVPVLDPRFAQLNTASIANKLRQGGINMPAPTEVRSSRRLFGLLPPSKSNIQATEEANKKILNDFRKKRGEAYSQMLLTEINRGM